MLSNLLKSLRSSNQTSTSKIRCLYTQSKPKGVIRPKPLQVPAQLLDASELPQSVPLEQLPYRVRRTRLAKWLPVYSQYRNGRTRMLTIVRRIDGDVEVCRYPVPNLRKRLRQDLSKIIPAENIKVHPLTRNLILNGNYVNVVRDWLTKVGF